MKNQIQQQPMPSYDGKYVELDEPLQSTCPELVETQIPTTSVTQMYPVKDDKVYRYVLTFNHYNGHKLILIFIYIYIHQITNTTSLKNTQMYLPSPGAILSCYYSEYLSVITFMSKSYLSLSQ